ncbi:MAG: PD40 domain-containing protein [Anaerolineae bacterium]|nr:PD40 domain-containing protein [Anaerolineae bacterium]
MITSRSLRYAVSCLLSLLLLTSVTPRLTRADAAPCLVMLKDGDLWMWCDGSEDIQQLTQYGHHRRPVMSPNGAYIAFNSIAPETVTALTALGYSATDISLDDWPSNMWVMSLIDRQPVQIAAQPAEIGFAGALPNNAVSRSNPTWSPDGQTIAWTEIVFDQNPALDSLTYRLVTYNLVTNTTQVIVPDLPKPYQKEETLRAIRVLWGAGGLALVISHEPPMRELYIFDPNGQQIVMASLGRENFYDFLWMNDGDRAYVGIMYFAKPWELVDPATGQAQPMNGTPEMYSTQGDNYATFITIKMNGAQIAGLEWQAAEKSISKVAPIDFHGETNFAHRITVSPVGVAFVSDAVYVWRESGVKRIKNTENIARGWEDTEAGGLAWGTTAWRVRR